MPSSKFFGIPFGASGDKATIPEATQPSGVVSYQQGFGPDYERDPATDPLAKRVPRDETNEFYFQVSNTLRYLQLFGLPEWYDVDGSGNDVSYPVAARVRHLDQAWVSIAATNTAIPGSDPTKWVLDTAFSVAGVEASLAQMLAGTDATTLSTPRRVASSVQRGAWNYAVAGGTANALTIALAPALLAYSAGLPLRFKASANSTGAVTLNVNGLGAVPLSPASFRLKNGSTYEVVYDGVSFALVGAYAGDAVLSALSRLTYTSAPVVANAVITTMPISTFTDDGQADFTRSGNILTCARAGRYQVLANFGAILQPTEFASAFTLGLQKNGAEYFSTSLSLSTTIINQLYGGASDVGDFAVGDTLNAWLFQVSGAPRTVSLQTRVAITRLTAAS